MLTKNSAYCRGINRSLCKVYNVFTLLFGIQSKEVNIPILTCKGSVKNVYSFVMLKFVMHYT